MFVIHRYHLPEQTKDVLRSMRPNFGYNGFGELIFYRTYSRIKKDGGQENWADCIIRVIEGVFSIRKDNYVKNNIIWDEEFWNNYATEMAIAAFKMQWLPPGRGLWAMGSDFVYERGSMALYNCAATRLRSGEDLVDDFCWLMDALMNGVGVGFGPERSEVKIHRPNGSFDFIIPDSREGWVESVWHLLRAYLVKDQPKPNQIYDKVRPAGMPIKGFGGIASGPDSLKELHHHIIYQCENYRDSVLFKTNVANLIGCTVVSGNVRRSAEIACGSINDPVFLDLKNAQKYPERVDFSWMSNNSAMLYDESDFDKLGEVSKRVISNGEPGIINLKNLKYGRIGKSMKGLKKDVANLFNPCGEIPLEHRETCNLSETFPTMCNSVDEWYKSCEYATFYCSTVTLLPTNQPTTNKVINRNRRIGVGIVDFTGWKYANSVHKITRWLRNGYKIVRATNKWLNEEAGIPESIRVTTIKPGGSIPKLPGKTSGLGHPTFIETIRRVRVQQNSPIEQILIQANIPYEKDTDSANTNVFEYPILQGPAKSAEEISLWEQANNLVLLQREWADNAVSNTLYFKPKWRLTDYLEGDEVEDEITRFLGLNIFKSIIKHKTKEYIIKDHWRFILSYSSDGEILDCKIYYFDPKHEEDDVEPVLSSIVPLIKSASLLPHTPKGVYKQMPEEGISKDEYTKRLEALRPMNWSIFNGSDGMDEKFCSGDVCESGVKL